MIQFQFYVKLNPSSKFCKHHSHDILYFKHNGIKKAFTMKDFFTNVSIGGLSIPYATKN